MSRRLLKWWTWVSALLLLTCLPIAIRSYSRHDSLSQAFRHSEQRTAYARRLTSAHGRVLLTEIITYAPEYDMARWESGFPAEAYTGRVTYWTGPASNITAFDNDRMYERLGFDFDEGYEPGTGDGYDFRFRFVVVPYWLLIVIFGAVPAVRTARWAVRFPAERRRTRGQCVGCGYDLRGTTDRCPECGMPVPNAAPAGAA